MWLCAICPWLCSTNLTMTFCVTLSNDFVIKVIAAQSRPTKSSANVLFTKSPPKNITLWREVTQSQEQKQNVKFDPYSHVNKRERDAETKCQLARQWKNRALSALTMAWPDYMTEDQTNTFIHKQNMYTYIYKDCQRWPWVNFNCSQSPTCFQSQLLCGCKYACTNSVTTPERPQP